MTDGADAARRNGGRQGHHFASPRLRVSEELCPSLFLRGGDGRQTWGRWQGGGRGGQNIMQVNA